MDSNILSAVAQLSNTELLARVTHLAAREREATAALIAHLAELDTRRAYLAEGCSSLFTYCTQVLHLSEHAAYGRISQRQVEALGARLRPQPPVPSSVRRLPTASHTAAEPTAPAEAAASSQPAGDAHGVASVRLPSPAIAPPAARPAVVAPLAPERYKVQFTASADTYAKLRLAQDLLRHQIPDGELGTIVDRALTALVQDLAKKKFAATDRPRGSRGTAPGSRHISAEVTRAVWLRDGGRCAFVIQLRCRAHNGYEAERYFGRRTPSGVEGARAPYVHPTEQPRRRSGLGITAATRSGPSTDPGRAAALPLSGRAAQPPDGADG